MTVKITYCENELIAMIRQNDKKGFDFLYTNYGAALAYVIGKIITDNHVAEDVLQETFINIWGNIEQYDASKGRLYTWMRNIAVNKCRDFLRCSIHNMRKRINGDEHQIDDRIFHTEQKTDHIGLRQLVVQMKNDHQQLIWLSYYRGHTFEEIACILNLPLGTVKSRMRRALELIRHKFTYTQPSI